MSLIPNTVRTVYKFPILHVYDSGMYTGYIYGPDNPLHIASPALLCNSGHEYI